MLDALRSVWECGEQHESALHMGDGFDIGGALERPGAGLLPVAHGLRVAPRFGVVVCQQFGLGGGDFRKPGFEELRNLLVILLSGAFQQGGVGGILDERMLEEIAGTGRPATLIEEFGTTSWIRPCCNVASSTVVSACRNS